MTNLDHVEDRSLSSKNSAGIDADAKGLLAAITNKARHDQAARAAAIRRQSARRRFVDPATTERDYSPAEMEFMFAMDQYKKSSGRMFPTWSEVLEVLEGLGYRKSLGEFE